MIQTHGKKTNPGLKVIAVIGAFSLLGCGNLSTPEYHKQKMGEMQLVNSAAIIVVGQIQNVILLPQERVVKDADLPFIKTARLYRLNLAIQETIKGSFQGNQLEVDFWGVGDFTNGAGLNIPFKGETAIHYLVSEGGRMRYVTDLVRSSTVLYSGRHASVTVTKIPVRIAQLLLVPGTGLDTEEFVRNFDTSVLRAQELIGYTGTLPLVENHLKSKSPEIRWAACKTLYGNIFIGQDSCLDDKTLSSFSAAEVQERRQILELRKRHAQWFKNSFLKDPLTFSKQYTILPGEEGLVDFLQLIAKHPDNELAGRAAIELKRFNTKEHPLDLL